MKQEPSRSAIIIDAGNTSVRVAGWSANSGAGADTGELSDLGVLETPADDNMGLFLSELAVVVARGAAESLVLTSVVPAVTQAVASRWSDVLVVDYRSRLPFSSQIPDLGQVGSDRLCNMAAAGACRMQRVLVVDAGTATTFDLLLNGEYMGGLIAPGMAFAAAQLGERAACLRPVEFVSCSLAPQTETRAAMQAGAYLVGVAGVKGVIADFVAKYGPLHIVLTGGLCRYLQAPEWRCDPQWTLRGAAMLGGLYSWL